MDLLFIMSFLKNQKTPSTKPSQSKGKMEIEKERSVSPFKAKNVVGNTNTSSSLQSSNLIEEKFVV